MPEMNSARKNTPDMFLVGNPSDIGYIGKIWLKFPPDLARKTRKTWFLVFSAGGNRFVPMREVRPQIYSFLACLEKSFFRRMAQKSLRLVGRLIYERRSEAQAAGSANRPFGSILAINSFARNCRAFRCPGGLFHSENAFPHL